MKSRSSLWWSLAALLLIAGMTVAASDPASPAAAAALAGSAALRAGDAAAAAAWFEKAAALEPREPQHWLKLASSRSHLKQWDAAIAAYRQAIELDPSATTYNNLANIYFRRGDYNTAAELYGRALAVDPNYLLARFHHGWCLRQLNRAAEAEAAFQSCLGIAPENDRERQTLLDCLFGLGSMRHRAGDYETSARMMEQVLAVHPAHPEARYYLGMAYRQLGRVEDARVQLEMHAQFMRSRHPGTPIEKPTEE